jgi:hypothetical protein
LFYGDIAPTTEVPFGKPEDRRRRLRKRFDRRWFVHGQYESFAALLGEMAAAADEAIRSL